MRAQDKPLDLNDLPEDFSSKGCKQAVEGGSSSAGGGEEDSGGKEWKEEKGKVYECRFCSLKFCKPQALGGHMNRHRQERETESLNRARQLLFGNDALPCVSERETESLNRARQLLFGNDARPHHLGALEQIE